TVTDQSGNSSTCTATVTVEDNIAPTAVCQDVTVQLDAMGNYTLMPAEVDGGSSDNCGIASMSVSPNSFTCTEVGPNVVTLTVTDAAGNTATCTANVQVDASSACIPPSIANEGGPDIADPCTCAGNGWFAEEIVVTAPSGQTWQIATVTGLYSDLPGTTPYGAGDLLTEVPQGGGVSQYILMGYHYDGIGYYIEVESPNYPGLILSIGNTCYYPEPVLDLPAEICLFTPPLTLADYASVTGNPALESESFTINGTPATQLDPMAWGVGAVTVEYTVDAGTAGGGDPADPGCVATATQIVNIVETPSVVACNDNVQVSVDENCQAFIQPDDILEGTYGCFDDYTVELYNGFDPVPNPVDGS
ncbi:MAG: hypothetical protein D6818_01755, partial [Bacteroidetes bacterium]